ncbi:10360_t:CDS:2 [Funneliformis caledonium]|uniref:10360_t:CDS:1 n=1 Tax=Funneliformis caledonium TaxID=1117310 RepID=A0A9N9N6F1_9GLOM|nr:10360_t:CDS:2 [Funneliformis caledonium]
MSKIDKFFERKSTKWNIIDFLNECDIETLEGKIDHYLKSLRAIVEREGGANQDKARYLLDRYNKDNRPGPDYKEARNWENKRTSAKAGSSFHFHNSTIAGNSLGCDSGVINNVKFPRKRSRKRDQEEGDHKVQEKTKRTMEDFFPRDVTQPHLQHEQTQQAHTPERHIASEDEEKKENEEDDGFDADLTIVGGKSTDWIISGINIREKLTNYQLEMRKEIKMAEVDTKNQEIKLFIKNIIDRDIKKTKENLNRRDAETFEKRFALHFVSHMVKVMEDVNLFHDPMSEGTYIIKVLAPILDYFFDKKKKDWLVSYGETCLKACAKDVNSSKKDDERRSSGKKIDTIICMREEDKEFSVIEVSGPPLKNDWTHFMGDRMKIMKMMKTLMNQFARLNPSSDITLVRLFGLQAYLNELTIYEFKLKYTEVYTTEAILTFPLPKTWADMANADKAIMGLLKYEHLLSESSKTIRDFLWAGGGVIEAIKMTTGMIHTPESNKKAENTTTMELI